MKLTDNANYDGEIFDQLTLQKATLRGSEFTDCRFKQCSFGEASFELCTFKDCAFANCDLSLMAPEKSAFRGVDFVKCKLLGVNWGKATWVNQQMQALLKTVSFKECVVNYSSFVGLRLPGLKLVECVARAADFSEADLSKSDFRKTDFEEALFRNTNLAGSNFVGATNYYIDPASNQISKARFSLPDALGLLYAMDIELEQDGAD